MPPFFKFRKAVMFVYKSNLCFGSLKYAVGYSQRREFLRQSMQPSNQNFHEVFSPKGQLEVYKNRDNWDNQLNYLTWPGLG